jgi:transcriptional regulator with XRE-family HTH domain
MSTPSTALGAALRDARGRVRQEDVAERMGVSQTYLSRLETGRIRPALRVLHQFATAAGLPPQTLAHLEALWRAEELAGLEEADEGEATPDSAGVAA